MPKQPEEPLKIPEPMDVIGPLPEPTHLYWAIGGLVAIAICLVLAYVWHPEQIGLILPIVGMLIAAVTPIIQGQVANYRAQQETHKTVNSRMGQMLILAKESARAAALLEALEKKINDRALGLVDRHLAGDTDAEAIRVITPASDKEGD